MIKPFKRLFTSTSYLKSTRSHVHGNTFPTLKNLTVSKLLEETSKAYPNHLALHSAHQKVSLTYEELNSKVSQVARAFIGLGINPGDRIGIYAPNCEEWALTQFACARIGGILVNINPAYQSNELKNALMKVRIKTLVMPQRLKYSNYLNVLSNIDESIKCTGLNPTALNLSVLKHLKNVILLNNDTVGEQNDNEYRKVSKDFNLIPWVDFLDNFSRPAYEEEIHIRAENIKPEDPTNIQFTSGTTGLPKGAVLSHLNLVNNGYLTGRIIKLDENDRILIQVPLYHCFGAVVGNISALNFGSAMIYPSPIFNPEASLRVTEESQATTLFGVPTMILDIVNSQLKEKRDVSSLSKGIIAGSVCPSYLMERVINELGINDMTIAYGMTELGPISHITRFTDSFYHRTSSVGRNLQHSESKIVDNSGNVVPRGIEGELLVKSFGNMLGYFEDEKANQEVFDADGFVKSGDVGNIDSEGFLHITGRKKDTIIRGGMNISPKEVEDFLGTMPKVSMAQVIAVEDEKLGDEICAWIQLKEGETMHKKEVVDFCRGKIAHHKIPRYVRFVSEFPMTITNKPKKIDMREISNKIIREKSEELDTKQI